MAKTLLICGNYGAGNFGDELILSGLLKSIRSTDSQSRGRLNINKIIVTSGDPISTSRDNGVTAIHFFPSSILSFVKSLATGKLFRSLYYLLKSDIVLFGGGCLFNEKEPDSIQIWYRQFQWFAFFRKKIIIVGQSFGTFASEKNKKILHKVVAYKNIEKIFVRDVESRRCIKALGAADVEVLADSALWLTREDFEQEKNIEKPYALIALRTWLGFDESDLHGKIESIAHYIFDIYGMKSKIVVLQKGENGDEKTSTKLYEKIKLITIDRPQSWNSIDDIAALYENAALVISMRLHGGIFGLVMEKPVIFLDYDDKVRNFVAGQKGNGVSGQSSYVLIDPRRDDTIIKAEGYIGLALDSLKKNHKNRIKNLSPEMAFHKCLTKIVNTLK